MTYCSSLAKMYRHNIGKAPCCLLLFSMVSIHFQTAARLPLTALPSQATAQSHTADSNTIEKSQKDSAETHAQASAITNSGMNKEQPAQALPTLSISEFSNCDTQLWLDDWYCHFNHGIESTVIEVNKWFVADHTPSAQRAKASGKLRFGWEPRSGDLNQLDFRFKIRVKLPALQDRVELLLSDDEGDLNQQAVKAARNQQLGSNDQATVALQFKDKPDSKLVYRIGLGRGSQIYTRARYSDRVDLNQQNSMNYYAEVNYYSDDQVGVETKISLNHRISKNQALELDNTFRYRDKTEDLFWRHEIQYLYIHDSKTSYLLTALVDGLNKPSYHEEQVLVSMRYKRNILRPWLFLEVEPFFLWLREENFRTSFGVALRAEVHFPQY